MSLKNLMAVMMILWGVSYLLAIVIIAWKTGDVPGPLIGAGPAGILGILVAFQSGAATTSPPAPTPPASPTINPEEK